MEHLKKLLALEARQQLPEEIFDRMLSYGREISLPTYGTMIEAGTYDPDIYVVKEGMIRGTYPGKNLETTAGFALPGSLLISFHCYYGEEPSYYRYEACCPTVVIKIPQRDFDRLLAESHAFSLWVMSAHQNQLYYGEYKNRLLSGDSKSRLIQLTKRLQGITKRTNKDEDSSCPDNDTHDSRVKNELHIRWREIFQLVPSKIIASYLGITQQHLSKIKKELLADAKTANDSARI